MQDPVVQMQQQEIAIRAKDADTKAQKVMLDAQAKEKELALKEQEFLLKAIKTDEELSLKAEIEGTKAGLEEARTMEQAAMRREQSRKGAKTK